MIKGFKNILRVVSIFVVFCLLVGGVAFEASARRGFQSTCKSVIFSDSTKVKRLYGKGVHNRVLPASTTKVMTALLVLEKLPLNKYITVRKSATYAQPTKCYLKPGEQYKVRDLLYAILLKSANDASIVLAEAVSGSEAKFVELMNKRAKQIGAKHTKFANSNGLPSGKKKQYTTAYDMYLIFRRAIKHKFFSSAIKMKHKIISSRGGRKIDLKSHNKILFKGWKQNIYGKTGYTKAAQACFVGTLQKGSSTLIIGVFGCTSRWEDIKRIVSSY
ncbi:D-alanyl-D-alanine carboxypeptidase family protein, partial [Candidatus Omnitrophota bacterium]